LALETSHKYLELLLKKMVKFTLLNKFKKPRYKESENKPTYLWRNIACQN
jgi:hypothetical protein